MPSALRALRVFFPVDRSESFNFDFFNIQGSGSNTSRKENPVPRRQLSDKRPEIFCRFEGCTIYFGSFLIPDYKNNVTPFKGFRGYRNRTFKPVRMHVS